MLERLSILHLAPVEYGASGRQALLDTVELAQHAEVLGYTRFWVAEHHNLPALASAVPDLLMGQIAARTTRIRVGSGGVMLPNHSPYRVAETFKALEAFYPGRLDLGIGRAPGSDAKAALALRRSPQSLNAHDLRAQLHELTSYDATQRPRSTSPFPELVAMPQDVALPPIWILGSSPNSSELAAEEDLPYVFAHHINPQGSKTAIVDYRRLYRRRWNREAPPVMATVAVLGGETAEALASEERILGIKFLVHAGYLPQTALATAATATVPPALQPAVQSYLATIVRGTFGELAEQLTALAADLDVSELMITTNQTEHASRLKLYEQLAATLLTNQP